MKERRHNGHTFLVYDSITELPAENFFKFNLNVALEAGIGGDMQAVMERNKELRQWIRRGRKKEAMQALSNMENAIMVIMSSVSPETNAFVCLVHSVDGEPVTDLSQEGMTRYLKQWSKKGLTIGKIKEWLKHSKKNFGHEVETFFPEVGNSPVVIERGNLLKQRTMAALRFIQGKTPEKEVKKLDDLLIELIRPNLYWGSKGVEVTRTNGFEDAMVVIRKELNIHGQMTAHQFLKHSQTVKAIFAARKKKK